MTGRVRGGVLVVGGGTGGHISPALAVAEELARLRPGLRVDFVRTPRPVDERMYAGMEERTHVLDAPRLDRGLADRLLFPPRALAALARSLRLMAALRPSALLATGGYSSFFPILAARIRGIPALLHESNSVPGRSNLRASRFCSRVMVGFRTATAAFGGKAVHTGNPVRPSMRRMPHGEARRALGLDPELPAVLFLGGSQGARAVNDVALASLGAGGLQLIVQCGSRDLPRVREAVGERAGATVFDFADDPSPLYSAADLAVARAGAMTVAELTWFRVPAVYVPFPGAMDDHQAGNASEAEALGCALLRRQRDHSAEELALEVAGLAGSGERLSAMREAATVAMPENPAGRIAGTLLEAAEAPR